MLNCLGAWNMLWALEGIVVGWREREGNVERKCVLELRECGASNFSLSFVVTLAIYLSCSEWKLIGNANVNLQAFFPLLPFLFILNSRIYTSITPMYGIFIEEFLLLCWPIICAFAHSKVLLPFSEESISGVLSWASLIQSRSLNPFL
jgi:hypothetical protein